MNLTIDDIAARFSRAVDVAHQLPRVRVQGYLNYWPTIIRMEHENLGLDDPKPRHIPPSPESIDDMLETMRWMQWLEEEQRHLIWMRAKNYDWRSICGRFGCDRTTAWRRWQKALSKIAMHLNLEDKNVKLGNG